MTDRIEAQCDNGVQGHAIEMPFEQDVKEIDMMESCTVGICPKCGSALLLPRGRFRASAGVLRWAAPLPMANRSTPLVGSAKDDVLGVSDD